MPKQSRFSGFFSRIFHTERGQSKGESRSWDSLYRTLAYRFQDEALLRQALTHRSYLSDGSMRCQSNERLEFLGDAVLGLVITDELYQRFDDKSEGELTKAKSYFVSREMLAKHAKKIGLGQYLLLGVGEEKAGGRQRKSILADAYEALLGAMFLDGGLEVVRQFIRTTQLGRVKRFFSHNFYKNFKSILLEHVQSEGQSSPEYRIQRETGPDHKKEFTVEVLVAGKVMGRGTGFNKKSAEQRAAMQAIQTLGLGEGKKR